jgi:AraC-like DNA-binding protein
MMIRRVLLEAPRNLPNCPQEKLAPNQKWSMKNVLFNSHDIVLALVIVLSFLLAVRVRSVAVLPRAGQILLPLFFVLHGLVALDTLLFWGDAIKFAAFSLSPWLPMLFSFASFALGPVIYWAFRSVLSPGKPIKATDYLQLLPALLTFPYLYWACYRFPFELQSELVLNLAIFSDANTHFMTFLTLKKIMPVIYGFLCVKLLFRKAPTTAKLAGVEPLLQPSTGFVFIWFWILLTHLLGQWLPVTTSDLMGLFGNYMSLTLVAALTYRSLGYSTAPAVPEAPAPAEPESEENAEDIAVLAEQIHKFIHTEKPYLNSRLTLERFAGLLHKSPRQVSQAINRGFEQNFHEYINGFRVEEAKRLLRDDACQSYSILEIAQQSGFNSKATFNRIFKTVTGATPTAYRREFSPDLEPHQHHC